MHERINGLIAAPFTPFDGRGDLALDVVGDYAPFLARNGLAGAFIAGTTGESMSMTVDERRRLVEAWCEAAPEGFRVIVHVGHTCLRDCQDMASHAQRCGAWGIGLMGPCFFRPATVDALVDWCAATAAAAPQLPFYYYHMPSMTGVDLPMEAFFAEACKRIPTMAGLKYTYEDLDEYARLRAAADGEYDIFFGRDELLLSGLEAGATAAVGSTYNFAAPLYLELIQAYQRGDIDHARQLQDAACRMIAACLNCGGAAIAALKTAMSFTGLPVGGVRPPLRDLTDEQRRRLKAEVESCVQIARCRPAEQ